MVLITILLLFLPLNHITPYCLPENERNSFRRALYYNGRNEKITIEVSPRPSHRIISHIFKLLVQERLRYDEEGAVEFNSVGWDGAEAVLRRLRTPSNGGGAHAAESFVNLEVWEKGAGSPQIRRAAAGENYGPLGPLVRKGIFIKESVARQYRQNWQYLKKESSNHSLLLSMPHKMGYDDTFISKLNSSFQLKFNPSQGQTDDLILNWWPNTDTIDNYKPIYFPDCQLDQDGISLSADNQINCDFQMYQISKLGWKNIKTHAYQIYSLLTNFTLTQSDYIGLIKKVNAALINSGSLVQLSQQYYQIACEWILNNRQVWKKWMPEWNKRDKVYIPILLADYDEMKVEEYSKYVIKAVERLSQRFSKKYGLVIEPILRHLPCNETAVLYSYLSIMEQYASKIIGSVVRLCPHTFDILVTHSEMKNKLVMSSSIKSPKYHNFTYYFSTQPSNDHLNLILVQMMKQFNWARLVIMKKDNYLLDKSILNLNGIDVLAEYDEPIDSLTFNKTLKILQEARTKHRATIFVLDYPIQQADMIMCAADSLKMNFENNFLFIVLSNEKMDYRLYNSSACSRMRNFLSLGYNIGAEHSMKYFRIINSKLSSKTTSAIYYLGIALDLVLQEVPNAHLFLDDPKIARLFLKLAKHKTTVIDSKEKKYRKIFDENSHIIVQWVISETKTVMDDGFQITVPLLDWYQSNGFNANNLPIFNNVNYRDGKSQYVNYKLKIKDTLMPLSDCPVYTIAQAFGMDCTWTIVLIHLISVIGIVGIFIPIIFICYKRQTIIPEETNLKEFEYLCDELTPIDINKADVIINDHVGKGAFGIVFCGEAKINNHWESVAIKIIDKKTDCQGKIDFLMEAKLMRGLEHPNIVRLVGICLNPGKPIIYLVMELMLNGDLRDYLLSNRINAKNDPQDKTVCPSKLTAFVLDIANGAHYLHSNGLLHRDLACRNCFLTEENVVKIGDFGLTRKIDDEKEYYRVGRHFVLPARWMSPEAIDLGYFSIQSDIWSFGVVVYEIVSFCATPYNTISDDEVPDHVKNNIKPLVMYLPSEARSSLVYRFIEKCMEYRQQDRFEGMSQIIDFLNKNPECIFAYPTDDVATHPNCNHIINNMNPQQTDQIHTSKTHIADVLLPTRKKWGSRPNISLNTATTPSVINPSANDTHHHNSMINLDYINDKVYRALNDTNQFSHGPHNATDGTVTATTHDMMDPNTDQLVTLFRNSQYISYDESTAAKLNLGSGWCNFGPNHPAVRANSITNRVGSGGKSKKKFGKSTTGYLGRKKHVSGGAAGSGRSKSNKSNLDNAKSRSSDLIAGRIVYDDQEQSFASCPDNNQNSVLYIDPQDFQFVSEELSSFNPDSGPDTVPSGSSNNMTDASGQKAKQNNFYLGYARNAAKEGKPKSNRVNVRNPTLYPKNASSNQHHIFSSSTNHPSSAIVPLLSPSSSSTTAPYNRHHHHGNRANKPPTSIMGGKSKSQRNSRDYSRLSSTAGVLSLFRDSTDDAVADYDDGNTGERRSAPASAHNKTNSDSFSVLNK